MDKCCEEYVKKCKPRHIEFGSFEEIHKCDKCGQSMQITFEGQECVGDENEPQAYSVVAVEYVIVLDEAPE